MKTRILLGTVVLFLVITACKGTFQIGLEPSTPSPTPLVSTATLAPSATPLAPAITPTAIPASPTAQLGTPTALPAGNIVMAAGTTAGVVQGSLLPGQDVAYTLGAGQSQPMILIVNSPNNDVTLGVF